MKCVMRAAEAIWQLKLSFKRLPRSCVARNDDSKEAKELRKQDQTLIQTITAASLEIKGTTLIYLDDKISI